MDRLDSCYFCGDAFDASLSEYPVVPKELQPPDDGPTVVLCGDCRGKLGAVIEEVVAATEADTASETATVSQEAGTDARSTNGTEPADASGGSLLDDGDESSTTDASEWESPVGDNSAGEESTASDEASARTTGASGTSDSSTDDGSEPTLTKLEYNKVMRLLKNRQFPVDRGEIREVATSAYEISPEEFDAVIEAAIERDLIAVENGQFVDPA